MKKSLLTLILIVSLHNAFSQFYNFNQLNQTYVDIPNGAVISSPGWDYLDVYDIPFPFQFKYFGIDFDTFYVSGGFGGFEYYGSGYFGNNQLYFYDAPIMDPGFGAGAISYLIAGNTPNRIVKMQIENAAFVDDQTFSDYFDMQLWFYETTNVIEMHYGPRSVQSNSSWYSGYSGPTIALVRDTTTFIHLYGPANNATASTSYVADFVTGAPPENSIYQFTPVANAIDVISSLSVNVYPNPSSGRITVNASKLIGNSELVIYSLSGQIIKMQSVEPAINQISFDCSDGMYIIKIANDAGQYIQRLVINSHE